MARSMIEVPYDEVTFPPTCARCGTAPADTTVRLQRAKQSQSAWFFFGLIGAAIASAVRGSKGYVRFKVPYCTVCRKREQTLRLAAWGIGILGLLLACGLPMVAAGVEEEALSGAIGGIGVGLGLLLLLIGLPIVLIVFSGQKAVTIKRLNEKIGSVRLAFRNPVYFDEFRRLNLRRLVSFVLRHRLPLPVPLDQAIAAVSEEISEQEPRSPPSLAGYFDRGQLYLMTGSYARALDDLNRVVEVTGFENPHFVDAHYFRGQVHMQLDRSQEAVSDLENFVKASDDRHKVREAKRWLKRISKGF